MKLSVMTFRMHSPINSNLEPFMNPPLRLNRTERCPWIWAITLWMACSSLHASVIYSETFDSSSNTNLSAMGWKAYGGATAVDISSVAASNTLFVSGAAGNPGPATGYLAAIIGNNSTSNPNEYTSYATIETGLNLDLTGSTISWTMNASTGATVRVRLLVQVNGSWYASNVSDTSYGYYTPSQYGTGTDFTNAVTSDITKTFTFTTNSSAWSSFTLNSGNSLSLGSALSQPLESSVITGIGFYIMGGGTGRLDTLEISSVPEPGLVTLMAGSALFAIVLYRRRKGVKITV